MMKGIGGAVAGILVVLILAVAVVGMFGLYTLSVTPTTPTVAADFDGEFDDVLIPSEGPFYSDFLEYVDCNVTDDYVGGSSYDSCVFRSTVGINGSAPSAYGGGQNSTDFNFDVVIDMDGAVKEMEIDVALQNSGTCKPTDDMVIRKAEIWTHESDPQLVADLTPFIEDNVDIDATIGPGTLLQQGSQEYVLRLLLHTKGITPDCATGDDIAKIDLDLTTDGDRESARILVESA